MSKKQTSIDIKSNFSSGQGQIVDKTLLQEIHDEYNLKSYKQSLQSQISPEFASNVFNPAADFYEKTSNTQPSIISISLLILDILKRHHDIDLIGKGDIDYVMGHSLGEFAALVINDVFKHHPDEILWLVRQRGLLMEQALSHSPDKFKMSALVFPAMNFDDVEVLLKDSLKEVGTVGVANINNPQQIVISGEEKEVDQVVQLIKDKSNIKRRLRVFPLQVTTPFHNPLLESSKIKFNHIIEEKFNIERDERLKIPILSNLTGKPVYTYGEALDNFIEDFINPVQFKKSIEYVIDEPNDDLHFINIGPNASINQNSITKTDVSKKVSSNTPVGTVEEIKAFVEAYEK